MTISLKREIGDRNVWDLQKTAECHLCRFCVGAFPLFFPRYPYAFKALLRKQWRVVNPRETRQYEASKK